MKTISKRFLKGGLALLLAFVMLFGTTITGFAAVIDNAETSAEADITILGANSVASDGKYRLYFKFSGGSTWWNGTGCYHYAWVWGTNMTDQWCPIYKVGTTSTASTGSTTDVFYMNIPSGTLTGMKLIRAKSTSPGWSNYYNATGDISLPNNISSYNLVTAVTQDSSSITQTSRYTTVSVATKGATVTNASGGSGTSSDPYIVTPGQVMNVSATSTIDDHNFKVGYGYNSSTQYTTTATGTVTANSTEGTYSFNVYYTPLLGGSTSYRGTQSSTTVYYKVVQPGYSYTVTAGEGGTASPASGTASSVEITATPDTGYEFAGWETTNGSVASESSATTTFTPSANGANANATFKLQEYALTISESGATGGTFTIDGNSFASGNNVTHGTHTLGVTAPAGYKVTSINGGTANPATINVTSATTIAVVYEVDNKCSTSFADNSTMNLVLGGEATRTATLSHCTSGGTVSYSSSDTTVATVDANGKVKALKAGTTTITAKCSKGDEGSSATYTVKVNNPTFSVDNVTVDVNGTVTAVPTITANEPAGTYSYKFTSHSSNDDYYAVNETTGVITGQKPTSSCLVSAALVYNNTNVATTSFSVKVNEPEANLNKTTLKLLTGQTAKLSVTSTPGYESVAWTPASVVTVATDGTVSTTASTGTGNVTATVKYNEFYSKDLTCAVTVASPTLTVSPATLELNIGGGTTTGTITVTNNDTAGADGTDAVAPVLEVVSSKPDVATATVVDGKINVTAKATGTTTLTVSYRGVEKTVTVNVSQYDPYVYLYVTNNQDFDKLCIYSWVEGGSNITPLGTNMIYIGKNGDGDKIFAYRFLKTNKPNRFIITKDNSWNWQTADITVSWTTTDHKAFYFQSADSRTSMGDWTSSCMIVRPTVSVDDLTVVMGETGTAEATVANGDKVVWSIADTAYATVANVTTQTATVTSVAPGTTEISARAFVDTANSSIKTLPTNYATDTNCWPFISTEAIATVTVDPGSARVITVAPSYSDNGTDYNDGVTGGTVNATYDTQSGTSLEVPYNGVYTITATPKAGYAFNGWTKNNEAIEGDATLEVTAKDDANYVAKFVKTYTVTVATPAGIDSIKINNAPGTTYTAKAGETITVYGSPAEGYRLGDWTVEGTATATGTNTATATISNIQSDITVTPSAVKIYTVTYSQGVNRVNAIVGTVTVNGSTDNNKDFDAGTEVTLTATSTNRAFYGWYAADDTNFENPLSTDATYVIDSLDSDIDVVAMFYRPFTIEGEVPGTTVELEYDIVTDTYTGTSNGYTGNAFTVKDTFGTIANAADVDVTGGTHTGATVTGNANGYTLVPDTENYDTSAPITYTMRNKGTGTYYFDIALSTADKVEISVNGTKVADKAIGSKFSYEIVAPSGQYLSGATTDPAVDFEIVDGVITFTVPETNVNIVPVFSDYSYVELSDSTGITATGLKTGYKAGEAVEITLSPASEATTITSVVADYDNAVIAQNGDNWTITIASMPADTTITLTTTVDAKFVMDYSSQAIGNYGTGVTTGFGTVTMTIGDTTLAKGGYAGPTNTVTYTATESNANYSFAGFYSDIDCKNVLSYESTYNVKPSADTTVYVLWARRQYMDFDSGTTNIIKELTYDKEKRVYTLSTVLADNSSANAISKGAWFQVTNDKNSWTAEPSYHHFGSDFTVTHNANSFDATISWNDGGDSWKLSTSAANDTAIKFILTPTGNTAIDFSAQVGEVGSYVYLSSGRLDLPGSYNATVFEATSKFTTEGIENPTDVYVANEGENREKYKRISLSEAKTLSFETEITGTAASNYEVNSYVVYYIDDKSYDVVTPVSLGSNKFSGSVYVDGPCYIVPIYFLTSAYAEENNLAEIDIYFDATAIHDQNWGPFVACYAWGSNNAEYHGGWSGQMMIPTLDGKSFYTMLTVPKAGATGAPSVPNGVTFNNYTQSTVPGSNPGAFGISATQYQCYDYREPITLYEAGYDVITFVAKDSTDGYHGDRANGVTANTVTSSTTDIFNKYNFDYLYSRDGMTPMDFNGDEIENPVDLSTGAKADYYVITKGDITYDPNGTKYVGDAQFDADWAVDWYIFDKDGKFITNILSTAMWDDKDENLDDLHTYLHDALGTNKAGVAGKTVAISYEHENNAGHQVSYDGQWYGNYLQDKVAGHVKVGFQEGDTITINPNEETPNIADYGEGYLVDSEGAYHQTLEILLDYGMVDLHAARKDGYAFVGWFTQLPDGTYKKISNAFDFNTNINLEETYYAIFRELTEGEVVINHTVYNNPNDPAIPSHGGVSEMYVEVRDSQGNLVSNGITSTSRSSASFEGTENETYTITITTTPLLNGEFFAWYTDSTNVDGTKTYEEVFTDDSQIGSTTKVTATFEYTYTLDSQKVINIYSDVKRVTNSATLLYKYYNRFGELRTYTVKDVPLTDDECIGFVGNGGNAYVPAYLTAYTFMDNGGNEVVVYGEDRYKEYIANGSYTYLGSYNKISAYAPKSDVTEVFDGTVVWDVADTQLTTEKSLVTLFASQGVPTYTINYTMGDQSGSKTDYYNELIKIDAPATYGGKAFSYWYEPATGEILTYSRFYNYRIVEDKTIVAVFGETNLQEWVPSINSITNTREFADGGDYIYTDHLLAFNNVDGKVLKDVQTAENIEYGLMILRDADYYIEDADNVVYPDATDAEIADRLKTIASVRKKNSAFTAADGNKYNCYFYNLSDNDLTNFNRLDYYVKYDNNKLVDTSHNYREFAFTAVAYIIVDGTVYLSNPKTTNFFELGNQAVTDSTN